MYKSELYVKILIFFFFFQLKNIYIYINFSAIKNIIYKNIYRVNCEKSYIKIYILINFKFNNILRYIYRNFII